MVRLISTLAVAFALAACSTDRSTPDSRSSGAATTVPVDATNNVSRASQRSTPRIVFLGDSLTAGLGLEQAQSFPSLLQARLASQGYRYEVVNAGVSGDTSAGGLRRLDWALEGDVAILVVELGANDGLRGLPVDQLRANLDEIITRARRKNIAVLITGMEAPPNYGPEYTEAFRATYRDLAATHGVSLVPFLLDRVAGMAALNNPDGIHPNPAGAQIVADTVWAGLEPLLERPR